MSASERETSPDRPGRARGISIDPRALDPSGRILTAMTALVSAEAALRAGSWERARAAFTVAADTTADPAAYEGLAQAAWWLDDATDCIAARQDAYRRHRALGDDRGAARAATALAWDSSLFGLGKSVAQGWLGRARALLQPLDEVEEHGWLAVREAELALAITHDTDAAATAAARAFSIGQRLDVSDLQVVGEALVGLALTRAGEVDAGMARLDASVAAATAGDVIDPMWMGKVCCWLVAACNEQHDIVRAADWCARVEVICRERHLVPLFTVCRISYASVQVARGAWPVAERELTEALRNLSQSRRASRLQAVVQLGELRRRQGRIGEARDLFAQAEFHPMAIVGRARILLDDADPRSAWTLVAGLLASLPLAARLTRAQVLLPAVQMAAAADRPEEARLASRELRDTAILIGTHPLLAMAAVAEATLAEPVNAAPLLREAVQRFELAGLRYDEAEARILLAEAMIGLGDANGAREHVQAAQMTLSELSATPALGRARRLATAAEEANIGPLTPRECEVLGLVSQGLSNHDISRRLFISEHTVHRHVANILTKLDQTSRTGAASYAIHAGLL